MKVLFVDDEKNFRDLVETYSEETEYDIDVTTVGSAKEALQMVEEEDWDAIVSDYKMAPMDGLELLKELRDTGNDIPFILFTGKGREEVAMEALNLGAERYVKKGGDPEKQFQFLAQAIEQEVEHYVTKGEKEVQEAYFEQLFENSSEGIVLLDNQDKVIKANKGFEEMFGYAGEELKRKSLNEFIVPEEKISESSNLSKKILSGESLERETIRKNKDGTRIHVSLLGYPIRLREEQIGIFVIYRNLSGIKKKERKVKDLYEASIKMESRVSEDEIYEEILNSAQDILNFKSSSIALVEDGEFVVKATVAKNLEKGDRLSMEGIRALTFENREPYLIEDLSKWDEAKPTDTDFKSVISVPIGDEGVFQAMSYEKNYFNEFDLEMTEFLISHMNQVIKNIRSQKELEKSEKKYRTIFESANDGIFIIKDYVFVDCNEKVEEIFDHRRDEIIGKPPWYFSPERQYDVDSQKKAKEKIDRALEGEPQFFEWLHKRSDGTHIFTEVSLNRYGYGGENLVLAVVRDITKREKRKKKLEENKKKMESLHKIATDLERCEKEEEVYRQTMEAANEVLNFHDCALVMMDEETDEFVVKKTLRSEYDEGSRVPLGKGYLSKTFIEKRSFISRDLSEDDVAEPASEDFKSAISIPIGDVGVFQAMSDEKDYFDEEDLNLAETLISHTYQVIERIKSQKELRKRERRFRNIFDNALVGIYRTTPDGELLTANPRVAEMMGFESVEDIKSKDLSEISESLDYSRDEFKEIMEEQGVVKGFEGTHLLPDGTILNTIENAVAVKDEHGDIKYYEGTIQDITELKKTQRKLMESEKKYKAIFENTGTATAIIDEDGTISLANRKLERTAGYFRGGLEGQKFFDLVVDEDKERMQRYHELRREDPESVPNEYNFQGITKKGDIKDIHATVNMIPGTKKSVASLIDITDKKEMMKSRDRYRSELNKMNRKIDMMESYLNILSKTDLDAEQQEQIDKLNNIIKK